MPVGYGHHAINSHVLYLALAFNPSDLFFYVKGKRVLNHPDEEHGFLLDELPELVKNLNQLTKCIGEYKKSKMDILIENME